ncbi:MAG: paraquat-inducible protein A [Thiotrichales bacterium]|nr:paraquat-inducible protein A [Thiotrichales bacterium]
MLNRSFLGFLLLAAAYGVLIPGLTEPVLHIVTTLDKAELANLGKEALLGSSEIPGFIKSMANELFNNVTVNGTVVIQDSAKSILGASQALWNEGNRTVAAMILFFSVMVPAIKAGLLILHYGFSSFSWAKSAGKISGALSKWSMADVFVMALIIAFLAIKASAGTSALVETSITFEDGFYYFLGYCLLSIAGSQLLASGKQPTQ